MILNHIVRGEGHPVILLHGFCENLTVWEKQLDFLSQSFKTVALDLPGFGQNQRHTEILDISLMAKDVKETLDAIDIKKAVFIGHSLGGYVCLELAHQYPEAISKLCLVHSTAYSDSEVKKENRNKTINFVEQHGKEKFLETFVPSLFDAALRPDLSEEIYSLLDSALNTPQETILEVTAAMRDRPNRTNVLENATYPVLLVGGKNDSFIPVRHLEEQAAMNKNIDLEIIQEAGHISMIESPDLLNQILMTFID